MTQDDPMKFLEGLEVNLAQFRIELGTRMESGSMFVRFEMLSFYNKSSRRQIRKGLTQSIIDFPQKTDCVISHFAEGEDIENALGRTFAQKCLCSSPYRKNRALLGKSH
eukprot:TRINITY_DN8336_c0_g1_i2.p4 TRINITY_DN8336_c0_g1~~TRINITY_DN8336_c0_g1_i2.p4  ORF type:complete len:109 (-),score=0.96 TRINITY_DN8336_c0_g1_i2:845-1171(-)